MEVGLIYFEINPLSWNKKLNKILNCPVPKKQLQITDFWGIAPKETRLFYILIAIKLFKMRTFYILLDSDYDSSTYLLFHRTVLI